jgi:predicted naringenin-chalcone synthase
MSSYILATGTAVPQHRMSQTDALTMFQDLACAQPRQQRMAKVLFQRANVENRFTFVPHQSAYQWCVDANTPPQTIDRSSPLTHAPNPLPDVDPGNHHGLTTGQRMRLYDLFASDMAIESSTQAINASRLNAQNITHLVTVSCTGFAAPGVDVRLIQSLNLRPTIQRINVGFMGCHGAVNGIRTAMNITRADPQATVLVCCVELCSLHCRFQWGDEDNEKIIGNALFGDGSASLIISGRFAPPPEGLSVPPTNSPATAQQADMSWEIVDTGSVLIEDSQSALRWDIGDHGFEMILNSDIGDRIESALADWLTQWLAQHQLNLDDIDCWAVHPGGPKIIDSVQQSLNLSHDQLSVSLDILRRYGNMSSPTVLFILKEFRRQAPAAVAKSSSQPTQHALIIAFGPGMVAEVALVKRPA